MKDHIAIPLLVVGVALPLVVMGTYYICDNFPVAEEMRKSEAQAKEDMRLEAERIKEERRLARERAEEEKRLAREKTEEEQRLAREKAEEEQRLAREKAEEERRLAKERADEEKRKEEEARREAKRVEEKKRAEEAQRLAAQKAAAQKSEKVAIGGVSINLPFEQLKQELATRFGGIHESESDRGPFRAYIAAYGKVIPESVEDHGDGLRIYGDASRDYIAAVMFPCFNLSLFGLFKTEKYGGYGENWIGRNFMEKRTAFGGRVCLLGDSQNYFVCVTSFDSDEGGDPGKYEKALNDKYGEGEALNPGADKTFSQTYLRILDDGLIATVTRVEERKTYSAFFYFNKSVRDDLFKNLKKFAREKEREAREEREKKQKQKARDAGGI